MEDAKVIDLWEKAKQTAHESGFRCAIRGNRLYLINPEAGGEVEFETAEALMAYIWGWRYGSRWFEREGKTPQTGDGARP